MLPFVFELYQVSLLSYGRFEAGSIDPLPYPVYSKNTKIRKCMRCSDKHVFGTTTVNDKGQVVIPADARKALGIESDMKFMVIGDAKRKALVLVPTEVFEKKMQGFMGMFFKSDEPS